MSNLDTALEYLERGWSIIPILPDTKKPAVKWKPYQDTLPTPEEVEQWWRQWPSAHIALVTGQTSGLVVVDCDSQEAIELCRSVGIWSPVRARTPHGGLHLYFKHPRDGTWRGPRVGSNSTGTDWPQFPTLDFRGDGSYPVLPPSRGYEWEVDPGHDIDDAPLWQGWPMHLMHKELSEPLEEGPISFDSIDLSGARVVDAALTEWEATTQYVVEHFPDTRKIPTGQNNGRNSRVTRYAAQMIVRGYFGGPLREKVIEFMDHFFEDHLTEWEAICRSLEMAERRNHPERFDLDGNYVAPVTEAPSAAEEPAPALSLIRMRDAGSLITQAGATRYYMEPCIAVGSAVQIAAYTGHGKSLLVGHIVSALAASKPGDQFGPFEIAQPARTLYLNYEESRGTIGRRLEAFENVHGDTGDELQIWTPFLNNDDMPLNQPTSLKKLAAMINQVRPHIVVIDTTRSAYPGLKENDADSWAPLNSLIIKLRNAGITTIVLHHRNKGQDGAHVGKEAGSTNQLTQIETQIILDMVMEEKEKARSRNAIWDGDYEDSVYDALRQQLLPNERLVVVFQLTYGKNREENDLHAPIQWIGIASDLNTNKERIIGSTSPKQKARRLMADGYTINEIARALNRPVSVIDEWTATP